MINQLIQSAMTVGHMVTTSGFVKFPVMLLLALGLVLSPILVKPGFSAATSVELVAAPVSPQSPSTQVTFSVINVMPEGGEYEYRFYLKANGVWTMVQSYSPSASWNWDTGSEQPGVFSVRAEVRTAGSTVSREVFNIIDYTLTSEGTAVATFISLSPNLTSPQAVGAQVRFDAINVQPVGGDYEYRFYLKTNGVWAMVQSYSPSASWTWDTGSEQPGVFSVRAEVRGVGSTVSREAFNVVDYTLTSAGSTVATFVSLGTNLTSPQAVGAQVRFDAINVQPVGGDYEYRFYLKTNGVWAMVQSYSPSASWTWDTGSAQPGVFSVRAEVRGVGSTVSREVFNVIDYTLTSPTATSVSLSPNLTSPQAVGAQVRFEAINVQPAGGDYEYRFYLKTNGIWAMVQSYSPSASWTWDTGSAQPGVFSVRAEVRGVGSTVSRETFTTLNFEIETEGLLLISPVTVVARSTGAELSWSTSEATSARIDYGLSAAYGESLTRLPLATTRTLRLSGLTPATEYHYQVTVTDDANKVVSTTDQTFTTLDPVVDLSGVVSDDFSSAAIDSRWSLYDPLEDVTAAVVGSGTADARLSLELPAGVAHDAWTEDTSPRLLQTVNNTDFSVELKFDSVVTDKYQGQGLIVQQDNNNWLRFDFYSDGAQTYVFAASKFGGQLNTMINKAFIVTGTSLYLRVTRVGHLWIEDYSQDGLNWINVSNFSFALNVTSLGPFAINFNTAGNEPYHNALVDYFFNTKSPVIPEDPTEPPVLFNLDLAVTGSGVVTSNPPGTSFIAGTQVQLTATANPGWAFSDWTGDLSGQTNPATIVMSAIRSVTANFIVDTVPPLIGPINVAPGANGAVLSLTTNEPTTLEIDYGEDSAYGQVSVQTEAKTSHSIVLSGLTPATLYHYQVTAQDGAGLSSQTTDLTFTTLEQTVDTSGIISDDFSSPNLNLSLWSLVDPLNDATVIVDGSASNSRLLFSIPAGLSHDPWTINTAPRIMQAANNTDFALEVKFESLPQLGYQEQGILVEQDSENWLRFDFYSTGTTTNIFAANSQTDGVMTTRINEDIATGIPLYMKVGRSGDEWTTSYSFDGINWTDAGGFSQPLVVNAVGPFVGNFGTSNNAPAFTAMIDYFFNANVPIVPEDGTTPADIQPPLLQHLAHLVNPHGLNASWMTDEPASGLVEYGLTQSLELGTTGHAEFLTGHEVILTGLQEETDYYYRVISVDALGNRSESAVYSIHTPALNDWAPVIDLWSGTDQTFGQLGIPQPVVNILGTVTGSAPIASLTYSLNGGPQLPLTVGPDGLRLVAPGDFNIELPIVDLQEGVNSVDIVALDTAGYQSVSSMQVNFIGGNQWPQNYSIDWSVVPSIEAAAQIIDGRWIKQADGVRTTQVGYDRMIAIGDLVWQDYEVTVPITVHATQYLGSNPPAVGIIVRWAGHTPDGKQPAERWSPLGVFGMYRWYLTNPALRLYDAGYQIVDPAGMQLQLGVQYMFKLRTRTLPGPMTEYKFKVWPTADSEPVDWTVTYQEGPADLDAGSVLLVAHYVDATFGNVTVVPVIE